MAGIGKVILVVDRIPVQLPIHPTPLAQIWQAQQVICFSIKDTII